MPPIQALSSSDNQHSIPEVEKDYEFAALSTVFDPPENPVQQNECFNNMGPHCLDSPNQLEHELAAPRQTVETVDRTESRKRHRSSQLRSKVYTISYLVFFAALGTLTRLVIETLTFYPGTPVTTSTLWSNVAGSLVMGFLSEDHELFRSGAPQVSTTDPEAGNKATRKAHISAHKKIIPLYIGLTTGYCGCLTTFSTFMRDTFLAISNNLPYPLAPYVDISLFQSIPPSVAKAPNGGFSFMAVLAVLITEIGLSMVALFTGAHLAIFTKPWMPTVPYSFLRERLDPLMMVLAPLLWVLIICLATLLPRSPAKGTLWSSSIWRGPFLYSLAFAPVGCLIRFVISVSLNRRIPSFPLGTFIANISGTMILGMVFSLQHASLNSSSLGGGSIAGCQVLQGIIDGFCGSLTTVSTWVLELSDSKRRHSYVYGGVSVATALALLVIEVGSLRWTKGFSTPSCFP